MIRKTVKAEKHGNEIRMNYSRFPRRSHIATLMGSGLTLK